MEVNGMKDRRNIDTWHLTFLVKLRNPLSCSWLEFRISLPPNGEIPNPAGFQISQLRDVPKKIY